MNASLMAFGPLQPLVDAPVWVVLLLKITAILFAAWLAHLALATDRLSERLAVSWPERPSRLLAGKGKFGVTPVYKKIANSHFHPLILDHIAHA